jgi:hypothetical protein
MRVELETIFSGTETSVVGAGSSGSSPGDDASTKLEIQFGPRPISHLQQCTNKVLLSYLVRSEKLFRVPESSHNQDGGEARGQKNERMENFILERVQTRMASVHIEATHLRKCAMLWSTCSASKIAIPDAVELMLDGVLVTTR